MIVEAVRYHSNQLLHYFISVGWLEPIERRKISFQFLDCVELVRKLLIYDVDFLPAGTVLLSERNVKIFPVDLNGNTIKLSKQYIITLPTLLFPELLEKIKLSLFVV